MPFERPGATPAPPPNCTGVQAKVNADDERTYTLDGDDTIVEVTGSWDSFALANSGSSVVSSNVLGKKLDRVVSGDAALMFVRTMILSARTLNRPVYRTYRCDSPELRRFMEMTVLPLGQRSVRVVHRQLYCEPVVHQVPMEGMLSAGSGNYVKRCSMCNRIRTQGIWSEADAAVEEGRVVPSANPLKVIYGVCPDCLARPAVTL